MSELFNSLIAELGERISQNTSFIIDNQKEIDFILSDTSIDKGVAKVSSLVEINARLQVENREFLMIQLKLRSFLRSSNQSTLLSIEENTGFWIDEATEQFILSRNDFLNDDSVKFNSLEGEASRSMHSSSGLVFNFNDDKVDELYPSQHLIEQCIKDEKYELCSMLINVFGSRN